MRYVHETGCHEYEPAKNVNERDEIFNNQYTIINAQGGKLTVAGFKLLVAGKNKATMTPKGMMAFVVCLKKLYVVRYTLFAIQGNLTISEVETYNVPRKTYYLLIMLTAAPPPGASFRVSFVVLSTSTCLIL